MVIEDDPVIRKICTLVLTRWGYRAISAEHGRDALNKMITTPDLHLILLDVMMPEMPGDVFIERKSQNPLWKDIPVAVMSALEELPSSLSGYAFLKKPMGLDDLRNVVEKCCA